MDFAWVDFACTISHYPWLAVNAGCIKNHRKDDYKYMSSVDLGGCLVF